MGEREGIIQQRPFELAGELPREHRGLNALRCPRRANNQAPRRWARESAIKRIDVPAQHHGPEQAQTREARARQQQQP